MFIIPAFLALVGLLFTSTPITTATVFPVSNGSKVPCQEKAISEQWHDTISENYLKMWNGDLHYLNISLAPDVVQYIDRIPTGNGSREVIVTNSTAFEAWIHFSREPFSEYTFSTKVRIGVDNIVALRWGLSAVPKASLSGAAPGNSTISINGTDILVLDRCTGLIKEVQGSSDTINFAHQLGQDIGKV